MAFPARWRAIQSGDRWTTRGCAEQEFPTPLVQGEPPEWIWERTPEAPKWEVVPSDQPDGNTVYELRVQCGLEIMRLQFFTAEEIKHLASLPAEHGP